MLHVLGALVYINEWEPGDRREVAMPRMLLRDSDRVANSLNSKSVKGSAEQRLIFLVLMAAGVVLCFLRMCFVRWLFTAAL